MYLAFPTTYIILVFGLKKAMFFVRLDKNNLITQYFRVFPQFHQENICSVLSDFNR